MNQEEKPQNAGLGATLGNVGGAVKDGVVNSLKGLNEIENQIVTVARNTVTDTLKATGDVAGSVVEVSSDIIKGTLKATEEVGYGILMST